MTVPLSLCPNFLFLKGHQSNWIRVHPNNLILTELIFLKGEGNSNLLQYSCLETRMDKGAWWATVHGAAKESDMTWQLKTREETWCHHRDCGMSFLKGIAAAGSFSSHSAAEPWRAKRPSLFLLQSHNSLCRDPGEKAHSTASHHYNLLCSWYKSGIPTPAFHFRAASPCGLAGKESACNAGDLGSIPGLRRFPGEGKGCFCCCC